jgi:hypothetical protein
MATPRTNEEILKQFGIVPAPAPAAGAPAAAPPTGRSNAEILKQFGIQPEPEPPKLSKTAPTTDVNLRTRKALSTVIGNTVEEQRAARLRAELAAAPDFDTYMKISNQLADLENALEPREAAAYPGGPTRKQGESGPFGVPQLSIDASPKPLDVQTGVSPTLFDILRPQTRVGPIVQEELAGTGKMRERGNLPMLLIPEDSIAERVKGKTAEERQFLLDEVAASREMIRKLAEDNPNASPGSIYQQYIIELKDIDAAMNGKGRLGMTTQEPGKAPNMAAAIYSRQTTPGFVPNLTASQQAYLQKYYSSTYARRSAEAEAGLRTRLAAEDVPDISNIGNLSEEDISSGRIGVTKRKRTPAELEAAVKGQLPDEVARLQLPWWASDKREEILANPEKFATTKPLVYGGEIVYPSGATKEGVGANLLRLGLAPVNVITAGAISGAARVGEAAGQAVFGEGRSLDTPGGVVGEARAKRGGKAADLPEDFLGDIAEAAMLNRGGASTGGDVYEAIGYPKVAGMALGLGLDLIVPPLGGVGSASVAGVKAFSAGRAIRAAGLVAKEAPVMSGVRAAANAMRDAWTWREMGPLLGGAANRAVTARGLGEAVPMAESLLPGSLRIAAAEDTGKLLGFRQALREELAAGGVLDEATIRRIAERHEATVGPGKWLTDYTEAAANGESVYLARALAADVSDISAKGHYLSGTKKLLTETDRITEGVMAAKSAGRAELTEPVLRAVLRNAAGRSDAITDLLRANPGGGVSALLEQALVLDREAVRAAVPAVAAFDALVSASANAKGFQTFKDLVLITNRHLGSPAGAAKAIEAATETRVGRRIADLTKELEQGSAKIERAVPNASLPGIRTDRPVQVLRLQPNEIAELLEDVNLLETGGFLSGPKAAYARAFLKEEDSIAVSSLRDLTEANLDDVISAQRAGVDINTIQFNPVKDARTLGGRLEAAAEARARMQLFTPAQMRSSLDGAYVTALAFSKRATAASKIIDTPPAMQRAISDFAAETSRSHLTMKALVDDLSPKNSEMRAAYGLPLGKTLPPIEILSAIARGPTSQVAAQSSYFINHTVDLMMVGYQDTSRSFWGMNDLWVERSYFSTAQDKYLTKDGIQAMFALKQTAKSALAGGERVDVVVEDLRAGLVELAKDRTKMSSAWTLQGGAVIKAEEIPKVLGGAMYLREAESAKEAVVLGALTESEVVSVTANYPKIRSVSQDVQKGLGEVPEGVRYFEFGEGGPKITDKDAVRMLIYSSMVSRANGRRAPADVMATLKRLLTGKDEADSANIARALLNQDPALGNALNNIMPIVNAAADRALARNRLNVSSVESFVEASRDGAKSNEYAKTVSVIRGEEVQSALDSFVNQNIQQKVFEQVAEYLPQNKTGAQRVLGLTADVFQALGNARYNSFLYLRGAYHAVNVMTAPAILHMTLGAEGFPKLPALKDAVRAMEAGPVGMAVGAADNTVAFRDSIGRVFTYEDLRAIGIRSGALKTEQQVLFGGGMQQAVEAEATRMQVASGKSMPKTVLAALKNIASMPAEVANSTDNFWRMASLSEALRQGKPISVAQEIAKKSLFDYGGLLPGERQVASRALIFYTFARMSAEQTAKALVTTSGAARFVRQAALSRDTSEFANALAGGDDYDVRKFYMTDKQYARIRGASQQVGSNLFVQTFPSLPSQDAFMTMSGIMYATNPFEVVGGTQTGLFQYLTPELKYLVEKAPEEPEYKKRADKMRIMDPRHVAALCDTEAMVPACAFFGDITPLNPTRDTTATYLDHEWQLTEEGFQKYKVMQKTAEFMGWTSLATYYAPLFVGEDKLQLPGKDRLGTALGAPFLPVVTQEQQEETVLNKQADITGKRAKQREDQAETQRVLDLREKIK